MRDRATAIEPSCSRAIMRTFHSFGAWFLRRNAAAAGLDSNFTIYDDDDQATLLHGAMPQNTRVECARMVQGISRAKDLGLEPDSPDLSDAFSDHGMRRVYALYEERCGTRAMSTSATSSGFPRGSCARTRRCGGARGNASASSSSTSTRTPTSRAIRNRRQACTT